jgi:hypothetical protein
MTLEQTFASALTVWEPADRQPRTEFGDKIRAVAKALS